MILEEETFKEFGYYPSNLKPKSNRKVLVTCDECGMIREVERSHYSSLCGSCSHKGEKHHLFGKHRSREIREKIRKANKGQVPWNRGGNLSEGHKKKISKTNKEKPPWLGKHHSKETKQKISDAQIGEKNHIFGKHHSEGTRRKMREARKHRRFPTHHTKPELIFEEICERNNLDFHYVGDGQLWIGKDKVLNPDFIEANGKKICVEIMGAWWHSPLLNRNIKEQALLKYRKNHYKKYKWQPIFIWDTDLLRKDVDIFVLDKLKKGGYNFVI